MTAREVINRLEELISNGMDESKEFTVKTYSDYGRYDAEVFSIEYLEEKLVADTD